MKQLFFVLSVVLSLVASGQVQAEPIDENQGLVDLSEEIVGGMEGVTASELSSMQFLFSASNSATMSVGGLVSTGPSHSPASRRSFPPASTSLQSTTPMGFLMSPVKQTRGKQRIPTYPPNRW